MGLLCTIRCHSCNKINKSEIERENSTKYSILTFSLAAPTQPKIARAINMRLAAMMIMSPTKVPAALSAPYCLRIFISTTANPKMQRETN